MDSYILNRSLERKLVVISRVLEIVRPTSTSFSILANDVSAKGREDSLSLLGSQNFCEQKHYRALHKLCEDSHFPSSTRKSSPRQCLAHHHRFAFQRISFVFFSCTAALTAVVIVAQSTSLALHQMYFIGIASEVDTFQRECLKWE